MSRKRGHHSQRHLQKLPLVDTKKMSKKEKIERTKIVDAFTIKKKAGPPKVGKEARKINKMIGKKDLSGIRNAIRNENHWPTKALLIRNLAMLKYRIAASMQIQSLAVVQ